MTQSQDTDKWFPFEWGEPVVVEKVVADRPGYAKLRTVRSICAVIGIVCWVFAAVLLVHVVLVAAGASPGHGFAAFVTNWAGIINLGTSGLFPVGNEALAVLANEGLAAVLWLVIGALLTNLISRIALPADQRRGWYRRDRHTAIRR
ncbi:hypothetical protein [Lentzea nigeriaca]|uniref:hypothetical protein n=1 Tax=Lentzea nigeriaca TaxID=1128665 RepID=UPI00195D1FD5|nr:hypothetical protein [Lentzea nigeriaca]MBM7864288.1 hypothetical protein [Lentzea nigeriaca]